MAKARPNTEQPEPAEGQPAPPEGQEEQAAPAQPAPKPPKPAAKPAPPKDKARLGQVVHYHLPEGGRKEGQARAAVVTRVGRDGLVNLHVLLNGDEYQPAEYPGHNWLRVEVEYDPEGSPDSWRFAEER